MTHEHQLCRSLTDQDFTQQLRLLAVHEQKATAELVAALAEFDTRRLYLAEGCSSLYVYCTRVLCLSEAAAYRRIQAARTATRFPQIFDQLFDGELTVTNVDPTKATSSCAAAPTTSTKRTSPSAAR